MKHTPQGRDALADALGIDQQDPAQQRADQLVRADMHLLTSLNRARQQGGYTVEDVANLTGWTVDEVRAFESYSSDPYLSEIRRYAHAIGVSVNHTVGT